METPGIYRSGVIYLLALWYILASTQILFVLTDWMMTPVVIEQATPACSAQGCGCSPDEPDRICCCTGKTGRKMHSSQPQPTTSALPITYSYLSAAYCAGNLPDQQAVKPAPLLHVLTRTTANVLPLETFHIFPPYSVKLPDRTDAPPDKVPIQFF